MTIAINYQNEDGHECGYVLRKTEDGEAIRMTKINMKASNWDTEYLNQTDIDALVKRLVQDFRDSRQTHSIRYSYE